MDKTKNNHDKIERLPNGVEITSGTHVTIHKRPAKGESRFHREFGLWVCRAGRSGRSGSTVHFPTLRYFEFYCISQLLDGTGYYRDESGELTTFKPGQGVLLTPGTRHMYGGYHESYLENTLCFSGRIPDVLCGLGIISPGMITMDNPRRLLSIINKAMDPGITSQAEANIELIKYLHDLHTMNRNIPHSNDIIDELTNLIQRDHSRWWTVREMAEFCKMSDVNFRQMFRKRHGMSPKRYLDSLKVNSAIERLSDTSQSVSDIATALGYIDPFHFSRRFKQFTGYSPRHYRQRVLIK